MCRHVTTTASPNHKNKPNFLSQACHCTKKSLAFQQSQLQQLLGVCESIEYIRPANCQLLFYTLSIVNHTPETPTIWTLSQGAYKKTMKETWLAKKLSVFLAFLHSLRCFGQKMHRHVCGKGKRVFYHLVMYYSLIIHSVICSYSVMHSNSVFLNSSLGGSDVFPKKKCTSRISHQRFVKPATESPIGFFSADPF